MNDIIGKKFYRLLVVSFDSKKQRYDKNGKKKGFSYYYKCKCDCGQTTIVRKEHLLSGGVKSCKCFLKDNGASSKHKVWSHNKRLYKSWNTMMYRCYNEKSTHWNDYGGRGISVCKEWKNPVVFEEWAMSNGYQDNLTIDRIDVNGNYCPENCRWVTQAEQGRNKRTNVFITINGVKKCLAEWCETYKISPDCVSYRVKKRNMSLVKAITTPKGVRLCKS